MLKKSDWPETGEYVIVTITAINPNSLFATLNEYGNKSGMVHISEASNKWVRDLRQHFKVGQRSVAKIKGIDRAKGHISLSLKRVKPTAKREKVAEWKNEKKAENLILFVAKELSMSKEDIYKKAGFIFQEKLGLVYPGFEIAATDGAKKLVELGIEKSIADKIEEIAKKNIKPKEVEIKGTLEITSFAPNGIELIKDALKTDNKNIMISYISAPKYKFKAKGKEYLSLEKEVASATGEIIEKIEKSGGKAEFIRA